MNKSIPVFSIIVLLLLSCSTPPPIPQNYRVRDLTINNSVIRIEHVAIPFQAGDSELFLEGMLYYDLNRTAYRGIVNTHGRNGPRPSRNKNEVFGSQNLNIALAKKGAAVLYIVRRGYGESQGDDAEFLSTPAASGLAAALDLGAGVEYLKGLGTVNPSGIIIMGGSQGGWAALSAASADIEGVLFTVNLCGGTNYSSMGLGFITEKVQQDWAQGCAELGAAARIPSLWIYSENDRNHPPKYVKLMFDEYIKSGGRGKLNILPPFKDNGHYIINEPQLYLDYIFEYIDELEAGLLHQQ